MRKEFIAVMTLAAAGVFTTGALTHVQAAQDSTPPQDAQPGQQDGGHFGGRGRGPGGGMMFARGTTGTVTAVSGSAITITADGTNDTWTVTLGDDARIVRFSDNGGPGAQNGQGEGRRTPPEQLKLADIHSGDMITANGHADDTKKTVEARMIRVLTQQQAAVLRQHEADEGKTWVGGRVASISGTTITVTGENGKQFTVAADENTSFHSRRDSITLADIHPGDAVYATGAVKGSAFTATSIQSFPMGPRNGAPNQN